MEQFVEKNRQNLKLTRLLELSESVSAMRVAETADVTLSCGDTDFPAHRLILEASSPYFVTMFNTGLEESKTGVVVFKEMEVETLKAVLDFLYTGIVDDIKTEEQVKNVLAAAHLMHLEQLVQYCCDAFIASLSLDNFLRIWNNVKVFEKDDIEERILDYLEENYREIEVSTEILALTCEQMQTFLNYIKVRFPNLDKVVMLLLRWLRHDLEERNKFAKSLFSCLDALLVSREFVNRISKDEDVMNASVEIADGIKDLFFTVHTLSERCNIVEPVSTPQTSLPTKLIFFSEYRMKEIQLGCTTTSCFREMRPQSYNCVQQFDLTTMTWQPLKKLCCSGYSDSAMVQYEQQIYMLGGSLGSTCIVYDTEANSVEYIGNCILSPRRNAGICVFEDHLYLIGGSDASGPKQVVERTKLPIPSDGCAKWEEFIHLKHNVCNPTIITATSFIYVLGDAKHENIEYIEYINVSQASHGYLKMAEIPNGIHLRVTVVGHTVYGLYSECESTMLMSNNDITKNKWKVTVLNECLLNITEMTPVPLSPNGPHLVYVSLNYGLRIPNFIWEPETDRWTKLPPAKGRCEIPIDDAIPKLYIVNV